MKTAERPGAILAFLRWRADCESRFFGFLPGLWNGAVGDASFSESASFFRIALYMKLMHSSNMRTTITLDEDVYQLATLYAAGRGITLGAAVGELVRRAETPAARKPAFKIGAHGLPVFSDRGRTITPQMVKDAQEDEVD
jgi:hypothetical protein